MEAFLHKVLDNVKWDTSFCIIYKNITKCSSYMITSEAGSELDEWHQYFADGNEQDFCFVPDINEVWKRTEFEKFKHRVKRKTIAKTPHEYVWMCLCMFGCIRKWMQKGMHGYAYIDVGVCVHVWVWVFVWQCVHVPGTHRFTCLCLGICEPVS